MSDVEFNGNTEDAGQAAPYAAPVEFGQDVEFVTADAMGVVKPEDDAEVGGFWGSAWGKFKGAVTAVYTSKAAKAALVEAANNVSPGAGDALAKGMTLVDAAAKGDPKAAQQLQGIVAAAKDNPKVAPAAAMLSTVVEARDDAAAQVATVAGVIAAVGAASLVTVALIKASGGHPAGYTITLSPASAAALMKKYPGKFRMMGAATAQTMAAIQQAQAQRTTTASANRVMPPRPASRTVASTTAAYAPQSAAALNIQRIMQQRLAASQQPYAQTPYGTQSYAQPYGYAPQGYQQPYGYAQPSYGPQGYAAPAGPEMDGGMADFEPEDDSAGDVDINADADASQD